MTNQKEYDFYIDRKVTIWERLKYSVTADSKEKAVGRMMDELKSPRLDDDIFIEAEYLLETSDDMTVEENGGFETAELFDRNDKLIANNLSNDESTIPTL